MACRSNIILKVKDGDLGRVISHDFKGKTYETKLEKSYIGIYCHNYGQIREMGKELLYKYNEYEKILGLISGGFASTICDVNPDYYMNWENREWNDVKPNQSPIIDVTSRWVDYVYIFEDGKWHVGLVHRDDERDYETVIGIVELTEDIVKKGYPWHKSFKNG